MVKLISDTILKVLIEMVIRYDVDCVHSMSAQITVHRIVLSEYTHKEGEIK